MEIKPVISQEIMPVLAFFELFAHPLTLPEIQDFALNPQLLKSLNDQSVFLINCQDNYFYLGQESYLINHSLLQEKLANQYWQKIKTIFPLLACLPYIKMIGVCNNLAFGSVEPGSDIDLLIITKANRLFIARAFLTFWLHIFGQRRHGQKIAGRFCLSFFLSEQHLDLTNLQIKPCDIYLAYWLKTIQPVLDEGLYKKFINANKIWLKNYFANPEILHTEHLIPSPTWCYLIKKTQEVILNTFLGHFLENILKSWQKTRAFKKKVKLGPQSSIIINDDILKFHNIDRRQEIYAKWQKKVSKLSKLSK